MSKSKNPLSDEKNRAPATMLVHGGTLSARTQKRGTTIVAVVPRTATGDTLSYLT